MTTAAVPMQRSHARALLVPTIVTAVMFAMLIALGVWQLYRREWKLGILAELDRAEASPPVPLPAHPLPFTKVTVSGRLRAGAYALYGVQVRDMPGTTTMGAQLIQVLDRPGQEPLLVDRGWVPDGPPPLADGEATVVGYVRPPDVPGPFSLTDDLAARHLYTLDPAKIGSVMGVPQVAPFTLIAMGGDGIPEPATALPRPPNDHLNYALTWFGLALSLLVVFGTYIRKVVRT